MSSMLPSWPSRLGPAPKLKELNFLFWGLLLVCFILPFSIVVIRSHRPPDADFAGFYSLGRILNEYPPSELYDYPLQKRICQEVHPRSGEYGPLPYPPYVAVFFRPFTLLPYWAAYALWISISALLYALGIRIVLKRFFPQRPLVSSLIYAFAFSYFPFIGFTIGNGQLAAVGFFALALAIQEDDQGHEIRSGLALCLCLYKPPILVLVLPMLAVTRRFKALLGFALGVIALLSVTTALEGFTVWPHFLGAIRSFGNSSIGIENHSFLPLAKYVDLTSFSSALHGGRSWLGLLLFGAVGLGALALLLRFWWTWTGPEPASKILLWATTLTWTLLINVYVPIYDSILIVLSVLLTAAALQRIRVRSLHWWFVVNWILILLCSWFSVPLSRATGVQILTLLFASFGLLQFAMLRRITNHVDPLLNEPKD
jgi:glycosyl transferase family 87